jgi:hypothetical protein
MWDNIAYKQLGSARYTGELMSLNAQYIDYYTLPAGVTLVMPETAPQEPGNVPPWKRRKSDG